MCRSSRSVSKGAQYLLYNAQVCTTLEEALSDVQYSVAFTRWIEGSPHHLPDLGSLLEQPEVQRVLQHTVEPTQAAAECTAAPDPTQAQIQTASLPTGATAGPAAIITGHGEGTGELWSAAMAATVKGRAGHGEMCSYREDACGGGAAVAVDEDSDGRGISSSDGSYASSDSSMEEDMTCHDELHLPAASADEFQRRDRAAITGSTCHGGVLQTGNSDEGRSCSKGSHCSPAGEVAGDGLFALDESEWSAAPCIEMTMMPIGVEVCLESDHALSPRIALVFGREEFGLSDEEVACCDVACSIPIGRLQESLSVGHAVSIVLSQLFQHKQGLVASSAPTRRGSRFVCKNVDA
jgi:hypothetical protein